jgi:hypothetical protein
MPTNTPIYNWPIPEDTDLVKDGAEAIRDLAGAIETTVDSSPTGLVHIKTVTDSGVTAINVNDCFSADYENYRIVVIYTAGAANANTTFRFRVSGSDNTTSNYNDTGFLVRTNAATVGFGVASATSFSNFWGHATQANEGFSADIYSPFATRRSKFAILGHGQDGTSLYARFGAGVFAATTSFTGFSLISSSGNIGAVIGVYGYKD